MVEEPDLVRAVCLPYSLALMYPMTDPEGSSSTIDTNYCRINGFLLVVVVSLVEVMTWLGFMGKFIHGGI